ncbi:hypothetical protein H5300_17095 [Vibrio sp. SG41-7]|uniref:hypothetical protein n=1 Tax=Vibrio sp. SG41-7 TaxID=2760973 RepID=UPI0015FF2FAE|nr:hypothetical protein [Vibrio sp. SG41-7]MBB1465024.1 hypothetical protein [Vibrio sp. SG41-7]
MSSPTCTSILHFSVFAVGIYFSVISSALNRWVSKDELLTQGASSLFSTVVAGFALSILIFVLNQTAIGKKKTLEDKNNQDTYREKIEELQQAIRLAPPNGFAKLLADYVDVADDFVQAVLQKSSRLQTARSYASKLVGVESREIYQGIEKLHHKIDKTAINEKKEEIKKIIRTLESGQEVTASHIRAILAAYSRLAAQFDGIKPSGDNIYRANLMLKYNISDKQIKQSDVFRYVPSILKGNESSSIKHYLTLHQEHSIKIFKEKERISEHDGSKLVPLAFEADEDISTFSLPFFLGKDKKHYNCFGAPRAVVEVKHQIINDTQKEIENWSRQQVSPTELVEEAKEHFNRRDIAKSIISIPIMNSRYDEVHNSSIYVMGVVNIYRDKPDLMMGNASKQQQFVHITTPLNFALSKIVAHDMVYRYNVNFLKDVLDFVNQDSEDCITQGVPDG